jgi:type I restriction enzyme S subunit
MKCSGEKSRSIWSPDLPAHWDVTKLGYLLEEMPCYGVLVPDQAAEGVRMLRIKDLTEPAISIDDVAYISQSLSEQYSRTLIQEGDLLLTVVGTLGVAVEVPKNWEGMNLSRAIARLKIAGTADLGFVRWLLSSPHFGHYTDLTCVGTAQRVLNMIDLWRFSVPVPPLPEQRAIAAFLDRETAKLDALVEEQRRLIALLKEKRQAVISHAVTRGLDPTAPLKPSGIDWLGDIPAHWEATRLKFAAASIQTGPFGSQLHASDYVSGGTPMINPAHIEHEQLVPAEDVTVDPATTERLQEHRLELGDIVIARRGEMGRCAVTGEGSVGWLCGTGSLKVRVCQSNVRPDFLAEVIRTPAVRSFLRLASVGSTMDNLNSTILGEVAFGLPPLMEQEQIAEKVSSAKRVADALTAEATRAIALLQERRAALISAAVTGKIDLRDTTSEEEAA